MSIFQRLFGKPKEEQSALPTLEKLKETLEMLEKKEAFMQKKIGMEIERAKEFTRLKNKRAAIQCLKRKKMYEVQVDNLANHQLRIHDQMILLESAKATTEVVDALRSGASAMKNIQKETNIDSVDKILDDINEQTETMKQIQQTLGEPVGASEFDEDELLNELEELEALEMEEEMLKPPAPLPAVPARPVAAAQTPPRAQAAPARTAVQKDDDDEELEALQREMAA
ncbi:hypothetical protein CBR_g44400 [Chara braunii]|uniref:Uncharacterized protein n=1 Tax=Chara braunii TaxID=69332 RepID=A0A388LX93_CHABU|nr:hypothetical protein CBR_g44400 [Chara braunii]|eukprot:GBG86947.1 hypothetical protein CBR_g44400 [Chara braunii]